MNSDSSYSVTVARNGHCCSIDRLIPEDGYCSIAMVKVTVFIKLIVKQTDWKNEGERTAADNVCKATTSVLVAG